VGVHTTYAELIDHFAEVAAGQRRTRVTALQHGTKRVIDILFALAALVVLSPVLLVAGASVRLSSRGPALFRQERAGRDGRTFSVFKFRTMVVDQDAVIDLRMVEAQQELGVLVKLADDPRVTRVGAILRRTSVDELPQLLNVVRGDMSLVGPRPLIPFMLTPCPELAALRGAMRPGLTGLWQVTARHDNTTALAMAPQDLTYVTSFNLRTDLRILLMTVPRLVRGDGAV